jgi:hypothetical protein
MKQYLLNYNIDKFGGACGWIGMILIQFATIPITVKILMGLTDRLPPLDMVILVWSGLFLFLISAVINRQTLYIVSNAIGFFLQSILLALIAFR